MFAVTEAPLAIGLVLSLVVFQEVAHNLEGEGAETQGMTTTGKHRVLRLERNVSFPSGNSKSVVPLLIDIQAKIRKAIFAIAAILQTYQAKID